jgi:two-component system, NarL family, invasion response regulator UvrY
MIRVAMFDRSPIFEYGVRQLIAAANDLRMIDTDLTANLPLMTDVFLIGADTLVFDDTRTLIGEAGRIAPVLLFTDCAADQRTAELGGMTGVGGVLGRGVSARNLLDAIRALAAGRAITEPAVLAPDIAPGIRENTLSNREQQVLHQIAQGMTHGQIATAIGISRHTVDTYVKRIRSKLGAGNKAELTRIAILRRDVPAIPA